VFPNDSLNHLDVIFVKYALLRVKTRSMIE